MSETELRSVQDMLKVDVYQHDIVQIVNQDHHWFPALIIVDEPKSFGIQGYFWSVNNDRQKSNGQAFIRLESADFVKVGRVCLGVVDDPDNPDRGTALEIIPHRPEELKP
jgi:hypothetical protein